MKNSYIKLTARQYNSVFGAKNYVNTFFLVFLKLMFLGSAVFCSYILLSYSKIKNDMLTDILYYALFSFGVIFSVCLYIITDYTLKRIYFESSIKNEPSKMFTALKVSFQLKIIYLHFVRFFINLFYTLFYMLPSLAVAGITLYFLMGGMDTLIFYACTLLFLSLFILGVIFSLAAFQKFAFLDETATLNSSLSATETIKFLNRSDAKQCFKLLKFKLSFVFWFLLCVFIIPAFFVFPYYRRSMSLYAKQTLKIKSPKPVQEKPVIVLKFLPLKGS